MVTYSTWTEGGNSCEVNLEAIPRPDLYGLLLPPLREEDAKTGTMAYLNFWDDPDGEVYLWDDVTISMPCGTGWACDR